MISWVPISDPLTVVAGIVREPLPCFPLLVSITTIGRYLILSVVTLTWL